MTPLESYIDQIVNTGLSLGVSSTNVKVVRYTVIDSLFYLSYTQPELEDLEIYPSDIVWVCVDPDSPKFKRAYRSNAFFPGFWDSVTSLDALMRPQESTFAEFVFAPADTFNEEQFHAPLLPRVLSIGEVYGEGEAVPLEFIRTLVNDSSGGDNPSVVRRVDVLEQEVMRLESELANIDTTHNHNQDYISSTWRVQHGFGHHPSIIQVQNKSGCPMFPEDIIYDESKPNEFLVVFSSPELGSVACIR